MLAGMGLLLAGLALAPRTGAARDDGGLDVGLPVVTFHTAGGAAPRMAVEVADTPNVQHCGLGMRDFMPENQGMLFVFDADTTGQFYDGNTFIPLTLAWMAADGTILGLTDMHAIPPAFFNEQHWTLYSPPRPYRYVFEANQGWYDRNGVAVGDRADLSAALAIVGKQGERHTLCDIDTMRPVSGS
jgi:uncharacterized membrane protein (UPF0127 family)